MKLPVNYHEISSYKRRMVRDEYVRIQNGNCSFCGESLSGKASADVLSLPINKSLFPEHFFKWPVHLHHNHDTGMTIGAVHCQCNAVLWQYYGE